MLFLLRLTLRAPPPGFVSVARTLDFDDVGSQICQHHCTEGTGKDSRKIENFGLHGPLLAL